MNINRHNYEEYFLLYIDNELDETGRRAVESFIAANTDLAAELDILKQACLQPGDESIIFQPKKQLLEIASDSINAANHEEYFIKYIDNELNKEEAQAVETYVLQHPVLQEEFLQLKQTVLPFEEIVFEEKDLLYRHGKPAVINMRWTRLAVAAVVIFIAGAIWWMKPVNLAGPRKEIAVVSPVTKPAATSLQKPIITSPGNDVIIQKEFPVANTARQKNEVAINLKNTQKEEQSSPPVLQEASVLRSVSDKIISKGNNTDIAKTITVPDAVAMEIRKMVDKPVATEPQVASTTINAEPLAELDTDQPQEKNISIGAFQVNKEKMRGLFKRASRMFTSKLKTDENEEGKLQVAAFEINTKSR